jgi:hypothetical protein
MKTDLKEKHANLILFKYIGKEKFVSRPVFYHQVYCAKVKLG